MGLNGIHYCRNQYINTQLAAGITLDPNIIVMESEPSTQRQPSPNPMLRRAFSLPITQYAWREVRKGHPSVALEQLKVPVMHDLAPGEVLVQVEAAALNPIGYKLMSMLPNTVAKRPHTAENDFTGIVVASQGVTEFKHGDAVCGWVSQSMSQMTSQGALCHFVRVRADHCVRRPHNVTPIQAAGVCLAGLSAYKLLFEDAKVKAGQRIFINNGSGGVGSFAIQLAKAFGCHVTATASSTTRDFVLRLGADEVVDYQTEPVAQFLVKNPPEILFDAIVDCHGLSPDLYNNCEHYLKPEGIFATVAPATPSLFATATAGAGLFGRALRPAWLGGVSRNLRLLNLENSKDDLRALGDFISSGKVTPAVDSVFKFDDIFLAYERLMSGRAQGKVVVVVDSDLYVEQKHGKPKPT
ncbi:hypothetical protein FS842_001623 [Serendipita sp. 407]|nr:hypothetical protein FS842_001623 [Serendipita sp. 407]